MRLLYILIMCVVLSLPVCAQITVPVEPTAALNEDSNAKYLKPIPEENGKVYLLRELPLPDGMSETEAFDKLQKWMDRCMQDSRILAHNTVSGEDPQSLQQMVVQNLIFSSRILALDQTEMSYVLTASVQEGKLRLKMSHITYKYNGENRDRKMLKYTAEDHISDRAALFKKGKKMVPGFKKFRIKTIDLIDEYEASLKMTFLIK